ncbi:MAG: ribosome maturation factor RimM [Betaproteobacteria bacterium]|nr:ribosome maturation factor RimM [Burkholderiales bacterium]NBX14551.1 ribosome maturation factor RimM [Betaproteobacteria bacterium]NBX89426.1 ribosome maturation factor RimM [Betaproteobacteria bacterium]
MAVLPQLESAALPADAIEVGRIADAWGIKGWFKVITHSASPEALFSSKRWYLLPSDRAPLAPHAQALAGPVILKIKEAKDHSDTVVASAHDVPDRTAAEALKGARVFISRSSFPSTADGEYYWVDLLGLDVVNREGVALGQVKDLMSTGPQTVLVLSGAPADGDKPVERMIPFVAAFIDDVDLPARKITVDWQADY